MIKESNNANINLPSIASQSNWLNLVDDSCDCKNCQAILLLPFSRKQIPISQRDYDEILFHGYRPLFPLDKIIPPSRYINFE